MREAPAPALTGGEARPLSGADLLHPRPPAIASPESKSRGWGLAEWTVALSLLFASLPGPWLTLGLPAGLVFALFDRRLAARTAGVVVVALVSALMVGTGVGIALLAVAGAATVVCASVVARGEGQLGMDGIVAPALTIAGIGFAAALAFGGEWMGRWEAALGAGISEGGQRAIAQYRSLGMSEESLAGLEALMADFARGLLAIWPALAALAIWLGVWLALRLLGRWGRVGSDLGRRLTPRPFERFRPPEALVWPLIAGLAALWSNADWVQRAAANTALALGLVYAMTGLAVSWWWLGRRGLGAVARFALLGLAAMF
ncbi:MAG TPA: DUF2232 domain-containing protein, partial [Gemmatimonadota bacterium]|nr:DUF2232 domain-containing protein [Gemmatimonadota bacterium]